MMSVNVAPQIVKTPVNYVEVTTFELNSCLNLILNDSRPWTNCT